MKPPRPLVPGSLASLRSLVEKDVLGSAEIAVTEAIIRNTDEAVADEVCLALALTTLGVRLGHSCVDFTMIPTLCEQSAASEVAEDSTLVSTQGWADALCSSVLVHVADGTTATDSLLDDKPLIFDPKLQRLWLTRYATYEHTLATLLRERAQSPSALGDATLLRTATQSAFGGTFDESDPQFQAVESALNRRLSFIIGGPGTGKTYTVGRLLDAVSFVESQRDVSLNVVFAAPTGKAAERMTQAAGGRTVATTLHKLLGLYPGSPAGVDPQRTIGADIVVVDEASMVDLAMMTRLLGSLGPETHMVFVGDPDQLLSVDVGSVLRDVVDATQNGPEFLATSVTVLTQGHRFSGRLGDLAQAIRSGDDDAVCTVLGNSASNGIHWIRSNKGNPFEDTVQGVFTASREVVGAARARDAQRALEASLRVKTLCAHRIGPFGLTWWNRRIGAALGFSQGEWSPGRPVLITRNDPTNGIANGDVGVVVPGAQSPMLALRGDPDVRYLAPSRIAESEDWWAMTIHKSQGSEFDHVVVSLPPSSSPLLTRELLYTAVTRAKKQVTIIGSEEVVRQATKQRTLRASGLVERLSST